MRSLLTKDITGIVVLLAIFLVAGILLTGNDNGGKRLVGFESSPDPSIYNDRGSGTRGLFELTKRLGYRATVARTNWATLPQDAAILISANPDVAPRAGVFGVPHNPEQNGVLNGHDADGVRMWLHKGHTLILMADSLPAPSLTTSGGSPTTLGLPGGAFGDAFGLEVASSLGGAGLASYAPQQPVNIVRGVTGIRMHGGMRVQRFKGDETVLFGRPPSASGRGPAKGEAAVVEFPVGKGRVIAIADGYFGCNANLARADNAAFLSNVILAYSRPGDTVLFDEYHHGDIETDVSIWTALGPAVQHAAIQAALAAVVLVIILGARFGSPVPVQSRTRRNASEYVTSLAGLYRGARATVPALDIIYRQFLRDVCARLALPPDVKLDHLAETAARRAHLNAVDLKRLFGRCERALDQRSLPEGDLVELVRQMERFRKELGID